jgi:hypothetical protein
MTRALATAAALLLAAPAVTDRPSAPRPRSAASRAARPKPQAPVTITAAPVAGGATVTVRFDGAASDVNVEVRGLDGLAVASAGAPLSGRGFARGEAATLEVVFAQGADAGQLAVAVTGTFGGGRQFTTATFPVGRGPVERLEKAPPVTDAAGRRVKVMPSSAP